MYTREALLDIHDRSQRTLRALLQHCETLDAEAIDQEVPGFGYPSVRLQIHHLIGAQEYWLGVLQGHFEVEDDDHLYPTIATLQSYREKVASDVERYLISASPEDLNTPHERTTWGGKTRMLVPARVLLRTFVHIYQHQGQVVAQCRLLGSPAPAGLDFPLD